VVLCHPHPLYGGSMDNNDVRALASALVDNSMIAFMFNFRGVGRSQGSFGRGVAEQNDVAAALTWLASQPEVDVDKLGLVGYSFGAAVALPVGCSDERVKAMALISPPIEPAQVPWLKECAKPKLIVCGSQDFVVPAKGVKQVVQGAAEPKQFELVDGADHSWWGYEPELVGKVVEFLHGSLAKVKV
jgi:alpha/beta superfamily hydrolase